MWITAILAGMLAALLTGTLFLQALATYQVVSVAMDVVRFPPPGRRISVTSAGSDRITSLHLLCTGQRNDSQPTIILESDLGDLSTSWERVQFHLAEFPGISPLYRVCAYERAGYAWSQIGDVPRSSEVIAKELRQLLTLGDEKPPYLLVSHGSFGTRNVQEFAELHPQEVCGIVTINAGADPSESSDEDLANELWLLRALAPLGGSRWIHESLRLASRQEETSETAQDPRSVTVQDNKCMKGMLNDVVKVGGNKREMWWSEAVYEEVYARAMMIGEGRQTTERSSSSSSNGNNPMFFGTVWWEENVLKDEAGVKEVVRKVREVAHRAQVVYFAEDQTDV